MGPLCCLNARLLKKENDFEKIIKFLKFSQISSHWSSDHWKVDGQEGEVKNELNERKTKSLIPLRKNNALMEK